MTRHDEELDELIDRVAAEATFVPTVRQAGVVPQIPALASPSSLEVEELEADVLTIAPVDFAPLDLPSLAVADLETGGYQKE